MHLINTHTLELETFLYPRPSYAVLSHTWVDGEEVTFQEMQTGAGFEKPGYAKIKLCCSQAKEDGYDYAWVDTCCIDKTSSSELSESINSMFRWYQEAHICYVFLADVHEPEDIKAFRSSRWFGRGWTLQELLAPDKLIFYTSSWTSIGDKMKLSASIESVTAIRQEALRGQIAFCDVSVAERMSWAASRKTTREEDMAYSLLGIFDVNMSLLYGEGGQEAFRRLQEEIVKTTNDLSIFAWHAPEVFRGRVEICIFATSVRQFTYSSNVPILASPPQFPTELAGDIIKVRPPLQTIRGRSYGFLQHYLRNTHCVYAIPLEEIHPNVFVRLKGQVAVVEYSGLFQRDERSVSLVIRLQRYRETWAPPTYRWKTAVMFKSVPLGYRITAISPFDDSDVCRDTMIGTPFMASRPVWVEIRHNTDKNKVFIFYVHPSFSGKEFLQSRREEWIYPARSRDAASCSLATFGTQLVRRPVFTSLCRSDGDDDLHVYVNIQEYAAYETQRLYEPLEDIPPGRLHKPRGSAPWVQKVLVVEVTSTQASKHSFFIDV